ncbi:glycine oxidase ThiO [Spongiibacter marinus]|uniref:glycine oxidase ThiO n=1 Tax=Spongiibacter marinus TaxID=354246 RepID=UPI0003FE050A|nr:glycine oxidase ThiO [Spongiibacter marinus]
MSAMSIAVVGGGLLGRLLAWKLLQRGHRLCIFERGSRAAEQSAARIAASMLAPYTEVASAERQVFDWGLRALAWWPQHIAELSEATGVNITCRVDGSVVVAHELDQSTLAHFLQQLQAVVPDNLADVEQLTAARLAELEPELAGRYRNGLFLPHEGYLDNSALLRALDHAIAKLSGQWHEHVDVTDIEPGRLYAQGRWQDFDCVVDCRGIGAKGQLAGLRGVRGEVLWLRAPEVNLQRPVRLMHPRYKLYIAPRPDNRYVIGATEIESESMAPVTVRSHLELLSALYSLHSGFAEAEVEHAWSHCRPAMPNNLPVVMAEPGRLVVNGLYRHGYLLSPHVVEQALEKFDQGMCERVQVS